MIGRLIELAHRAISDIPLPHMIFWTSLLFVPTGESYDHRSDPVSPGDVCSHRLLTGSYLFCGPARVAVAIAVSVLKAATVLVFARYTAQELSALTSVIVLLVLFGARAHDWVVGALNGNAFGDAQRFAGIGAVSMLAATLCLTYVRRSTVHPHATRLIALAWAIVCLYAHLLTMQWFVVHRLLSNQRR